MKCPSCSSKDIDFSEAGGHSFCVRCGCVLEENAIVSSIEFQESGDRSHVVGQFVSASCSQPYTTNRTRGRFGGRDSRDTTLVNIRRIISQVAGGMRLPPLFVDRAYRLYQLALQKNFIFGRRQMHVVATCLYTICRQEKSPHLLIDFSDALQINVYILGKAYLQFSRVLNLKLPVVDPSLYIHRFAQRLDLGAKITSVSTTALRIVTRLKKDWIVTGRRPDSICAVAMLISSRVHGFVTSLLEFAKVFRISVMTLKARVDEFRATPSAQLTVDQFYQHDINVEFDPPAYINNQLKNLDDSDSENDDENCVPSAGGLRMDLDGGNFNAMENGVVYTTVGDVHLAVPVPLKKKGSSSVARLNKRQAYVTLYEDIYADIENAVARGLTDDTPFVDEDEEEGLPEVLEEILAADDTASAAPSDDLATVVSKERVRANKPKRAFANISASTQSRNVEASDYRSANDDSPAVGTEGLALSLVEADASSYILSESEQLKRHVIWEKTFRPYMDQRERRRQERERNEATGSSQKINSDGRPRKKNVRRNEAKASASQAVLDGPVDRLKQARASKKINYDALKGVFGQDGNFLLPEESGYLSK